jgi:hypothetical protein
MISAIGSLAQPGGFFPSLAGTQACLSRYTEIAIEAEVFYPRSSIASLQIRRRG